MEALFSCASSLYHELGELIMKTTSRVFGPEIANEEISHIEPRHVMYARPRSRRGVDLHTVKEIVHTKDGKTIPRFRHIYGYKRPFWITKEGLHRNHEQKKEWEELNKLDRYTCQQYELIPSITNVLNLYTTPPTLRQLFRNPYIYGADITSTALIKQRYLDRLTEKGFTPSQATVAGLDTETDVIHGHGDILMTGISYKNKAFTAVVKSFVRNIPNPIEELHKLARQYIPDLMKERGIEWEIVLVDTPGESVKLAAEKLHEWQPDWVSIWNIDFDVPVMEKALAADGLYPADVFSDPSVPREFRSFFYRKGPNQKRTDEGKLTPLPPHQQWHVVETPASFQFVDAMQAYRQVRTGGAEENSYSLNNIADVLKVDFKKLTFPEDEHIESGTLEWHEFMQKEYPLRYILYNLVDNVLLEAIDEKSKDLASTLNTFAGCSDLVNFKSQPRRKVDELHFELLRSKDRKLVIGTTSDQMKTEIDGMVFSLSGWIRKVVKY